MISSRSSHNISPWRLRVPDQNSFSGFLPVMVCWNAEVVWSISSWRNAQSEKAAVTKMFLTISSLLLSQGVRSAFWVCLPPDRRAVTQDFASNEVFCRRRLYAPLMVRPFSHRSSLWAMIACSREGHMKFR